MDGLGQVGTGRDDLERIRKVMGGYGLLGTGRDVEERARPEGYGRVRTIRNG